MNTQFLAMPGQDTFEVTNVATSGNTHPQPWFDEWISGGQPKEAGVTVNGYTALTHCPLWQGVNIIAGDLGQVPVKLVKDKFKEQKSHNAWNLLRVRPNDLQTPSVWAETMFQWALIYGNAVSWIPKVGSRVTDMIPLRPDCLWPELIAFDGRQVLLYHYWSPSTGREFTFMPDEVIHIQGLTSDGVWGYPLWQIAKSTIATGIAIDRHGNRTFSNGAQPSGVLEHPGKLGDEARKNLRNDWEKVHRGVDNAGKVAILWEGMKFNPVTMSNLDAQWGEAKKMSRIDAAGLLNLPPHKLGSLEDSSVRSNLEEQNEVYKQMTLTRWANRMDQELRRKLLTTAEWRSDSFQFVYQWGEFLKADIGTLIEVAVQGVNAELMNRNEGRDLIGMAPYEGGERYGSPAINPIPPKGGDTKATDEAFAERDEKPADEPESNPQNRLLAVDEAFAECLVDHIEVLLKREGLCLKQAAKESGNFVEWLDRFYTDADAQITKLCDTVLGSTVRACCAAGVDARGITPAVRNYAIRRHAQLLEACSTATKAELPAVVDTLADAERPVVARGLLAVALGSGVQPSPTRQEAVA